MLIRDLEKPGDFAKRVGWRVLSGQVTKGTYYEVIFKQRLYDTSKGAPGHECYYTGYRAYPVESEAVVIQVVLLSQTAWADDLEPAFIHARKLILDRLAEMGLPC